MTELERQIAGCFTVDSIIEAVGKTTKDFRVLRAIYVCTADGRDDLCSRAKITSNGCGFRMENGECVNFGEVL